MKKIPLILAIFVIFGQAGYAWAGSIDHNGPDADGDIMPDQWEICYGLNPNNPADADLDPDSDRLTNRDEFFAGTDPTMYDAAQNMREDQVLNLFAGKAFLYFWEQSRPYYYFTPDKAHYNDPNDYSANFNSIATTGFSMMAYMVADERGWVGHNAAYERVRALLSRAVTLQGAVYDKVGVPPNQQGNRHGYLYHFVDDYGLRHPGSEISTIDHALFVAGALVAGEYYKGTEVEQLARQLYVNTDWNWLYNGTFLYQGWIEDPAGTFEGGRTLDAWNRYSELMILLFLAMGNSDAAKGIPSSAWDALTYGTGRMFPYEYAHLYPQDTPQNFAFVPNMPSTITQQGYANSATEFHYIHAGSLHNHQYSHLFADFRSRRDRWQTDYCANSISATMANRQFCINLNTHAFGGDPSSPDPYYRQPYETYGANSWGIMAGIPSYTGYAVMQPIVMSYDDFSPDNIAVNNDSGTVLLSAPLGSTPFTPRQTIDFTRAMLGLFQTRADGYDALVGRYGFMNSFNLGRPYYSSQIGHFATSIIGLDMGPVAGSAENYTTGLVWKMAMRNQYISAGMQNAGFNTGAVEPFILNFDDNPPLPHEDPNGGGADPNSFGGYSYQFGTGAIEYVSIGDPFPEMPYGPQQWARQISASSAVDSGGFITLTNHDVSRWGRLSFWIKGQTGTEEYSVGLKDSVTDRVGNPLQTTEIKLPIARYHPDGAITSQWKEVRIPLRDYSAQGVRLTALDNISFTNTKAGGGTVYIDDIAFLGDEFKPSAPQGLSARMSGDLITLSWDINPEPDVVGYRIYRSDDREAMFLQRNTLLAVASTYTDTNFPGRRHLYRITAVDNADPANESVPSNTVSIFFNQAPILAPVGNRSIGEGSLLQFQVSATDPDLDPLTYSTSALQLGMTFTNQTFRWTPTYTQSGAYTVTFTVSDGYLVDYETITVTVNNVNRPPKAGTITPSSGSSTAGNEVTFETTFTDADGWTNIKSAHFLINIGVDGKNCFYGFYNRVTNKLYIRNESNTASLGGYAPGSSAVISHTYASLNCSKTQVTGSGDTMKIRWAIVFKSAFVGAKKMYLYAADDSDASTGWIERGAWTIENPNVARGKVVSLVPPTVESPVYCIQRGYVKEKLVDGVSFNVGNNSGLAYPGGMWYEPGSASTKAIVFDYAIDLGGNYTLDKVKFHWGYFGNHPTYTYVNSWAFYYWTLDTATGKWMWKEYTAASGSSKPWVTITEKQVSITTNKIRIKAWGVNWSGLYELEAFGRPSS